MGDYLDWGGEYWGGSRGEVQAVWIPSLHLTHTGKKQIFLKPKFMEYVETNKANVHETIN